MCIRDRFNIGALTEIGLMQYVDSTGVSTGVKPKMKFKPFADLHGGIGLTITNDDFNNPLFTGQEVQDAKAFIESVLGVPIVFAPPSINFKGFKINHPSLPKGKTFGLDDYQVIGSIPIGSFELNLNELKLIEASEMSFKGSGSGSSNFGSNFGNSSGSSSGNSSGSNSGSNSGSGIGGIGGVGNVGSIKLPGVGLGFKVSLPGVAFDVNFWAKEEIVNVANSTKTKKKYSFGKIELKAELPKFECGKNIQEIVIDQTAPLASGNIAELFETLKVGHFTLTPDFADGFTDNGNGVISGFGTIDVPVLGPLQTLNVAFTNVEVDQSGRIIKGDVTTQTRPGYNSGDLADVVSTVGAVSYTHLTLPTICSV